MNEYELEKLTAALYKRVKEDKRKATTIAIMAGVSQPTVSRIRNGKPGRLRTSISFNKLCNFYQIATAIESQGNVVNNQAITNAVLAVWDGSSEHAVALANVILSLKGIMTTAPVHNE